MLKYFKGIYFEIGKYLILLNIEYFNVDSTQWHYVDHSVHHDSLHNINPKA